MVPFSFEFIHKHFKRCRYSWQPAIIDSKAPVAVVVGRDALKVNPHLLRTVVSLIPEKKQLIQRISPHSPVALSTIRVNVISQVWSILPAILTIKEEHWPIWSHKGTLSSIWNRVFNFKTYKIKDNAEASIDLKKMHMKTIGVKDCWPSCRWVSPCLWWAGGFLGWLMSFRRWPWSVWWPSGRHSRL